MIIMPGIEYRSNGPTIDQHIPTIDEKEKLQYIVSTTSLESPLKSIESGNASETEGNCEQIDENQFLDPKVAQHWANVYEKSKYEGRHVFDPAFTWSKDEEKKLVRRLDWHVCLWAVSMLVYLACDSLC